MKRQYLYIVFLSCFFSIMMPAFGYGELVQQKVVQGTVYDESKLPLPGVNVSVKGTSTQTVTNEDGRFSIKASEGSILVFSFIGFTSREVSVANDYRSIEVDLVASQEVMDEVVVIGYGSVRRENLTGAVSTVSEKDIRKLPAANISQALQGNSTGVYSLQSDRNPGAGVSINVRGNNSFAGNEPLYVVDGVPMQAGGANAINPSDIASVSILKDASSTAIYGARAANGVIIIQTKEGRSGEGRLSVDVFRGIKTFSNPIEMMDAQQFADLRREAFERDGSQIPDNAFLDVEQTMLDQNQSTDWWNEVINNSARTENYQISFSGGSDRTRLYVSGALFNDKGIVNNSNFLRGNLRFNATQKISDKFTLSTYNNLSISNQLGSNATNILFPATVGNPMSPIKQENGDYFAMIQNALGTPRANPLAFSDLQINKILEPIVNSSLAVDFQPIKGLTFRTQLSGEIDNYRQNFYNPRAISGEDEVNGRISGGYASVSSNVNYNWISETTVNYTRLFAERHDVNLVAGFSAQQNRNETLSASASGFASDVYESYNLGASADEARKPSSSLTDWSLLSYFGRAIYTLDNKYILTGNFRVDGSSRFGEENKWGIFPSGAFAWKIKEESFMQDLNWVNDLKLRASYGTSGNWNAISPYQTLPRLGFASYNWNGVEGAGYYASTMPSADLRWETTAQFDLGLDFTVLENRLNVTFDYYVKNTKDLIRSVELPSTTGFPNTYKNLGDLENKGIELGIRSRNVGRDHFTWNTAFLISRNTNKLVSLGDGSERIGTTHWLGMPLGIGARYMIEADGIWQSNEVDQAAEFGSKPGDVRYIDQNNDGVIDNDDRVFVGSYMPKFYGSLTNDFIYKNFDLTLFMTYSQGRDVYNGNNYILLSGAGVDNNRIEMLERWTPENPSNKYPRASANASNRLSSQTSEFLEDASYIKVKTITLGYSTPASFNDRLGISSLRLYGTVYDPFTFTKYTGMDPEDGDIFNNDRSSSYPITTSFILGLQFNF